VPGDSERGVAYLACECACEATAAAAAEKWDVFGTGFAFAIAAVAFVPFWELASVVAFVVIDRVDAVADIGTAETEDMWAVAAASVVEGNVELDFAWNVGELRARKAPKKLAKKGRLVGIVLMFLEVIGGWRPGAVRERGCNGR